MSASSGARSEVADPPALARWVALCAVAEGIGMTAAATAAKVSQALVGEPAGRSEVLIALALVVTGGLIEGVALGVAQAVGLSAWLRSGGRRRWIWATTLVAGVGWAGASAPAMVAAPGGAEPPMLGTLAGAVGIGVVMGALLGGIQSWVLRGRVPHPRRWVLANVAAWSVAMPVIFVGATSPSPDWSLPAVVALGTGTGLAAGTVLGLVSGAFLPSLAGPSVSSRLVRTVLTSPAHRLLDRSLVALRFPGRRSGRTLTVPVMYAADGVGLVVTPGHAERKQWWRNLRRPLPVQVWLDGQWQSATGRVLEPGENGYAEAAATYRARWPRARSADGPLVRVELRGSAPTALMRTPLTVAAGPRGRHDRAPRAARSRADRSGRTRAG